MQSFSSINFSHELFFHGATPIDEGAMNYGKRDFDLSNSTKGGFPKLCLATIQRPSEPPLADRPPRELRCVTCYWSSGLRGRRRPRSPTRSGGAGHLPIGMRPAPEPPAPAFFLRMRLPPPRQWRTGSIARLRAGL